MANTKLVNVFVQANTIKGYRYLDDCGKIMLAFDEQFPIKGIQGDNLSGQTLSMTNSESPIRQVRVTTQVVWVHFESPDTLQFVIDQSTGIIEKICQLIDVQRFSRIAIRTQHILSDADLDVLAGKARSYFFQPALNQLLGVTSVTSDEAVNGFQFSFPVQVGDMAVNFQVGTAQLADEGSNTDYPRNGLLLDSDAYRNGEFSLAEFRRFLRGATSWVSKPVTGVVEALAGEKS